MATLPRIEGAEHTTKLDRSVIPQPAGPTSSGAGLAMMGQAIEQQSSKALALASMFDARADSINDNNLANYWGHVRIGRLQDAYNTVRQHITSDPESDPSGEIQGWAAKSLEVQTQVDEEMHAKGVKNRVIPLSHLASANSADALNREVMTYGRGLILERGRSQFNHELLKLGSGVVDENLQLGAGYTPGHLRLSFEKADTLARGAIAHGLFDASLVDKANRDAHNVMTKNALDNLDPRRVLMLAGPPLPGMEQEWGEWRMLLSQVDSSVSDITTLVMRAKEKILVGTKANLEIAETEHKIFESQSRANFDGFMRGFASGQVKQSSVEWNTLLQGMTVPDQEKALAQASSLTQMRLTPDPIGGDDRKKLLALEIDLIANPSQYSMDRLMAHRKFFTQKTWDDKILPRYFSELDKEKTGMQVYGKNMEQVAADHFRVNPLGQQSHFQSTAMGTYREGFWTAWTALPLQKQMDQNTVHQLSKYWLKEADEVYDRALSTAVNAIYQDYPQLKGKPAASVVRSALLKKVPTYEIDAIIEYLSVHGHLGVEPLGAGTNTPDKLLNLTGKQ